MAIQRVLNLTNRTRRRQEIALRTADINTIRTTTIFGGHTVDAGRLTAVGIILNLGDTGRIVPILAVAGTETTGTKVTDKVIVMESCTATVRNVLYFF